MQPGGNPGTAVPAKVHAEPAARDGIHGSRTGYADDELSRGGVNIPNVVRSDVQRGSHAGKRQSESSEVVAAGDIERSSSIGNTGGRSDVEDGADDVPVNFANAIVAAVGNVDRASSIGCDSSGRIQLRQVGGTVVATKSGRARPRQHREIPSGRDSIDDVRAKVRDIQRAVWIERDV